MNLHPTTPEQIGRTQARLQIIKDKNFRVIESTEFPGYAFQVCCNKCGHTLQINQRGWQFRHWLKCDETN